VTASGSIEPENGQSAGWRPGAGFYLGGLQIALSQRPRPLDFMGL